MEVQTRGALSGVTVSSQTFPSRTSSRSEKKDKAASWRSNLETYLLRFIRFNQFNPWSYIRSFSPDVTPFIFRFVLQSRKTAGCGRPVLPDLIHQPVRALHLHRERVSHRIPGEQSLCWPEALHGEGGVCGSENSRFWSADERTGRNRTWAAQTVQRQQVPHPTNRVTTLKYLYRFIV